MSTYYMTGTRTVPPGGMQVYGADYITNSDTVTRKTRRTIEAGTPRDAIAKWERETHRKYGAGATISIDRMFIKGPLNKWLELSSDCGNAEAHSANYEQDGNTYSASVACPFCSKEVGYTCTYDSPDDWEPASEDKTTCEHVQSLDVDVKLTVWFVDREKTGT